MRRSDRLSDRGRRRLSVDACGGSVGVVDACGGAGGKGMLTVAFGRRGIGRRGGDGEYGSSWTPRSPSSPAATDAAALLERWSRALSSESEMD